MFNSENISIIYDEVPKAILDTFWMTGWSGLFVLLFGLPLGLYLYVTSKDGLFENAWLNRPVSALVDAVRAIPWIILFVYLMPVSRFVVGKPFGNEATIFVLAISAIPFYARMAELSFRNIDKGLIDAIRSMGATRMQLIREVIIPESKSSLITGLTVTIIAIISASAITGFVGGNGLGRIAISYGYKRDMSDVMTVVVAILIALNVAVQWFGDHLSRKYDHSKR
ncbi:MULTISPECIES: methionine ABC transporter permease [unclassified Bartonella]|uniref:methionine ABC transporter permease n=1 Tax=unclassified Bartonella TaxID=2645622 RepID=UPI0015FD354E|nr:MULTISPECIES: methionine ABC transporter permease [unclassified Bartonella]UXN03681.1 ABC transporter permease [Bartonella sp. HY406]UXN06652.1 ABC transporter permease [Bartonella sp. HY761]